jgi:hypothetical protein
MVATADKNKKFFKNKKPEKPEELRKMPTHDWRMLLLSQKIYEDRQQKQWERR